MPHWGPKYHKTLIMTLFFCGTKFAFVCGEVIVLVTKGEYCVHGAKKKNKILSGASLRCSLSFPQHLAAAQWNLCREIYIFFPLPAMIHVYGACHPIITQIFIYCTFRTTICWLILPCRSEHICFAFHFSSHQLRTGLSASVGNGLVFTLSFNRHTNKKVRPASNTTTHTKELV